MSCVTKWKSLNYQMRFLSYAQAKGSEVCLLLFFEGNNAEELRHGALYLTGDETQYQPPG